jgi:HK97 family phage major capsid protein
MREETRQYRALLEERARLLAEAEELFEAAGRENRGLTAEERERDDQISARLEELNQDIARFERQRERMREQQAAARPMPEPRPPAALSLDEIDRSLAAAGSAASGSDYDLLWANGGLMETLVRRGMARANGGRADAAPGWMARSAERLAYTRWCRAFGTFLLQAVRQVVPEAEIQPWQLAAGPTGLSSGIGSDGGFLVGTQFSTFLLDRAMEQAVLAPMCLTVPIGENADGLEAVYIDESSRATGSRWGGVQVYRRAEAGTVASSGPKFATFELRLEDLMGLSYATERLLRDATALGAVMSMAFASEFAWRIDNEILRGSGAGECLGILSEGAPLVTVAKESGQAAQTIVAQNVIKMRARLWARSRPRSVWLVNQDAEPQLHQMSIAVGTSGGSLVYMPANGLASDGFDRLYGRPVIPIEQASTLGTVGDIILADFSGYVLITKGGIEAAESIHVRFLQAERAFRWLYRINGRPTWRTVLTPANGTATVAPFVALATRS